MGTSDIITRYQKIIKKCKKIEGILIKFLNQKLYKESKAKLKKFIQVI